ncbi:MAG: GxxExxY protein [Lewinellaceae bacterium]|nr:GxxExxY protein [Lewinellaceae bacterium]
MHDPLTAKIIAAAYKVHNTLGFGFLEKVYENALAIELSKCGLNFVRQASLQVYYEKEIVGEFQVDLWVNDQVIIELKSVRQLVENHEVQLINYLTATQTEVGLLLNFGPTGVTIKRKYRTYLAR